MRSICAMTAAALLSSACASSYPLSGAWEGTCTLSEPSPLTNTSDWRYRLVLAENEWAASGSSVTGWDFYTGRYEVTTTDRSWTGGGLQLGHCNLSDGCGDLNDPFYPTTADTYLDWSVAISDEAAGYPNVDMRFVGSVDGAAMSGDCRQVFVPWNAQNSAPFDISGTGQAEQVSTTEVPF